MNTKSSGPASFEFYFPNLDTLVLVEPSADEVVIRASRATFSDRRKEYFVRELASEGFISDAYRWFLIGGRGVRWVLDYSWVTINEAAIAQTRRWMITLLLSSGLLWLILIGTLGLHSPAPLANPYQSFGDKRASASLK